MTRNRTYILAGVAAAAVVGVAAAGAIAARGDWHHFGRHGAGFRGGPMMGGMGGFGLGIGSPTSRLCRGDAGEMADHVLVRIEHKIKPTDAQKPAFDDLKTAVRSAAEKIEASCPPKPDKTAEGEKHPRLTPVERLAQTQAGLEASLEAVKTVRPAAEKFYASLSDDQKAKFNPPRWRDKRGDDKPDDAAAEPADKTAPEAPAKE